MSVRRRARIVILCDFITMILILGISFKSELRPSEDRVTLFQCKTLSSREFPLLDKQGSYERPRGTFRTSLNERQLLLVCTDQVSHRLVLRVDRSLDDRLENRIPARE